MYMYNLLHTYAYAYAYVYMYVYLLYVPIMYMSLCMCIYVYVQYVYVYVYTYTFSHFSLPPLTFPLLYFSSRENLIRWFVRTQLSDYEVMFHESLEVAWLDKVDRRYSWLRRTLITYEEESITIFPPEWSIPERICVEFCNSTRSALIKYHYIQWEFFKLAWIET